MPKVDVIVRKNFPLVRGENVHEAMSELGKQGREHVLRKLNKSSEKSGAFMVEAFSTAAVFHVYDREANDTKTGHYAVAFKREKNGEYEFGAVQKVRRITRFEAVPNATPTLKAANGLDGWTEAPLFSGVI